MGEVSIGVIYNTLLDTNEGGLKGYTEVQGIHGEVYTDGRKWRSDFVQLSDILFLNETTIITYFGETIKR